MDKRNYKLYLKDILDSISKIEKYVKGLFYREFSNNLMVIDAPELKQKLKEIKI